MRHRTSHPHDCPVRAGALAMIHLDRPQDADWMIRKDETSSDEGTETSIIFPLTQHSFGDCVERFRNADNLRAELYEGLVLERIRIRQ
jgi:hypothetical protein